VREEFERCGDTGRAVTVALTRTARVIASPGAIAQGAILPLDE
jgi:hypothetical protein